MLMNGLDGQITTARTLPPAKRRHDVGLRAGSRRAGEGELAHDRAALLAHEIILEVDPAARRLRTRVRTRSSLIGRTRGPTPSRRQKSRGDLRQRLAGT